MKKEELENAEHYFGELHTPFPLIRINKKLKIKKEPVREVYNPNVVMKPEKQFARIPVDTSPAVSKFLLFSVYIYVLIALSVSFDRCVFLDLLLSFLLFSSLQLNIPMFIRSFAIKGIGGIIIAAIIDIIWLSFYTKPWWSTGYDDSFSLLGLRRAMVVLSYILMLIRILVLIALFLSYKNLQEGKDEFDMNRGPVYNEQTYFNPNISSNRDFPGF